MPLSQKTATWAGVIAPPSPSAVWAARRASAWAWSRVALSSSIRSLSAGSSRFAPPLSIAGYSRRLSGSLVEFGNVVAAAFGALLTPIEDRGENFRKTLGIEQARLQMAGEEIVGLVHWNRAAFAAGLALPRGG